MEVVIFTGGELEIKNVTDQQLQTIRNCWPGNHRRNNGEDVILWLDEEIEGSNPLERDVIIPVNGLIDFAKQEGLNVNGEIYISSEWQDYDNIVLIVKDNVVRQANLEIIAAGTDELLDELKQRGVHYSDPVEQKKVGTLVRILEKAIGELYNSAEDWYRDQVLDLIGTSTEELHTLGVANV